MREGERNTMQSDRHSRPQKERGTTNSSALFITLSLSFYRSDPQTDKRGIIQRSAFSRRQCASPLSSERHAQIAVRSTHVLQQSAIVTTTSHLLPCPSLPAAHTARPHAVEQGIGKAAAALLLNKRGGRTGTGDFVDEDLIPRRRDMRRRCGFCCDSTHGCGGTGSGKEAARERRRAAVWGSTNARQRCTGWWSGSGRGNC